MRRSRRLVAWATLALAAGCASAPPPVPILGARPDVAALAGTWAGDYWSPATGRSGSITFDLAAGADTAFGDVLMMPSRLPHATASHDGPRAGQPEALRIAFVRAARDSVFGYLDFYLDPECGCVLMTKFAGRLEGDEIRGRYLTRNTQTSEITSGEWNVRRKR